MFNLDPYKNVITTYGILYLYMAVIFLVSFIITYFVSKVMSKIDSQSFRQCLHLLYKTVRHKKKKILSWSFFPQPGQESTSKPEFRYSRNPFLHTSQFRLVPVLLLYCLRKTLWLFFTKCILFEYSWSFNCELVHSEMAEFP